MNESQRVPVAEVLHAGISTTLQDLGRSGAKKYGVPIGGVMDCASMRLANQLFGNSPNAAVYEILGGMKLRCMRNVWICLTGAGSATMNGQSISFHRTIHWQQGDKLSIFGSARGLWTYLAIPGGWNGGMLIGSRSVWPQVGMGRQLRCGDLLYPKDSSPFSLPSTVKARFTRNDQVPTFPVKDLIIPIRAWAGPQESQFPANSVTQFWHAPWTISLNSSRAGYRLEGLSLTAPAATMPSEPIILGSIQVPPNGQPIILLNDGPTIGGYPKIALVHAQNMDALRQLPPLSRIQFIRCD